MPVQQTINIVDSVGVNLTGASVIITDPIDGSQEFTSAPEVTLTSNQLILNIPFGTNPPLTGEFRIDYDANSQVCNNPYIPFTPEFVPEDRNVEFLFTNGNEGEWEFSCMNESAFTGNYNLQVVPRNPSTFNLLQTPEVKQGRDFVVTSLPGVTPRIGNGGTSVLVNPNIPGYLRPNRGVSGGCLRGPSAFSKTHALAIQTTPNPEPLQYFSVFQSYRNWNIILNEFIQNITELIIEGSFDNINWNTLYQNSGNISIVPPAAINTNWSLRVGFNENRTAYEFYRARTTIDADVNTYYCQSLAYAFGDPASDARLTNKWCFIKSNSQSQLDTSSFNNMEVVVNNQVTPSNTQIRYLVSVDGGFNWGVFPNTTSFNTIVSDINLPTHDWSGTNSMTVAQIQQGVFDISSYSSIDFAIALFTTSGGVTPTLDGLNVNLTI